ncbi:MAG TPA: hypothetical protein VIM02_14970 [Rhizomicrobium sp.]
MSGEIAARLTARGRWTINRRHAPFRLAQPAARDFWGSIMAKSKTRAGKTARTPRAGAKKPVSAAASAEGPEQSEKLVQIQGNKLLLLALREVGVLLQDRITDADRDIEALKKEREANKTFTSYRDINALRMLNAELAKLAAQVRTQLADLRKEQDRLLLSVKENG